MLFEAYLFTNALNTEFLNILVNSYIIIAFLYLSLSAGIVLFT